MTTPRVVLDHARASSLLHPCELYLDHGSARPAFTQSHHRFPQYLQMRLWGEVRLEDRLWLCGTCHDNLHGWLYIVMGEWSPFVLAEAVPLRARQQAAHVVSWFETAAAA